MLKKLLKYDFKSVFKYWWIAAVISLGLSFIGGFCIRVENIERPLPEVLIVVATALSSLSGMGFMAITFVSFVLVFWRFYKNFFSDEGYLTFTLPVKRSQLINSKLITSTLLYISSAVLLVFDILLMEMLGYGKEFFTKEYWKDFVEFFQEAYKSLGGYLIVYIVQILLFAVLATIFANLFLYCCITFASIITKKAKVITSIGVYYFVSGAITTISVVLVLFGSTGIAKQIEVMEMAELKVVISLMATVAILFVALLCVLLYALQYWMLDRKLNLT